MTARLVGRLAVVTGAASGIGLATARLFAAEGAIVTLVDRDGPAAREAAEALGAIHHAVAMDVTDEAAWIALHDELSARGGCDLLVNNAGIARLAPMKETGLAEWRATMTVNVDSVFLGCRALLPLLVRSGRAAIVNVSSIRGIIGGANATAYCASKGAVRLFTKALALEYAGRVRVNSVHPGLIETPLAAAALHDPAARARRMAALPVGRPGTPDEVADAILFAAGDTSSYMTGSEIVVDGGTVAA